jgi:CopG-like RHH_1 or ribbon-helix-helix domain, RHH_5
MVKQIRMKASKFVSKRINVTLPDSVVEDLEYWADAQGRSLANLAAFILESSVKKAKENGEPQFEHYPPKLLRFSPDKDSGVTIE